MKAAMNANQPSVSDGEPHRRDDLAVWLQEAAKRPWIDGPHSVNPSVLSGAELEARPGPRAHHYIQNRRHLVALAGLTIGFLQYYYLDVMVQIGSMSSVVVFVPLAVV